MILWVALCVLSTSATLANDKVIAELKANAPEQVSCQFEQQKFLKGMAKPVISKGVLQSYECGRQFGCNTPILGQRRAFLNFV